MRGNLAKAFELANTQMFRRAPLPKSYTDYLGRKLFLFLLTVQGLGAFALITLGVILKKNSVAKNVIRPRIRQEIFRAGVALLPMFFFVALALGFLVVGQTVSALAKVGAISYLGSTMVIVVVRELGPLLAAFLVLASLGRLGGPFPFSAGWGDIIVGVLAIPVAMLATRVAANDLRIVAWNVLGVLDLVVAVTLGIGSTNGSPLQFVHAGVGSAAMASLPWSLVPTVLVPLFLVGHGIVFAHVRAASVARGSRSTLRTPAAV